MLSNFWQSLGDKLAEKWLTGIVVPAAVFWFGGLLAWITRYESNGVASWFTHLSALLQGIVIIGALVGSAITGSFVQRLAPLMLGLLEGYWPTWSWPAWPWLRWLWLHLSWLRWLGISAWRRRLVERQKHHFTQKQDRWDALANKTPDDLGPEERNVFAMLDRQLKHFPAPDQLMPTHLGNILCAAELRPTVKYGLNIVVCWPRLWLVLPENVRTELAEARANLDTAVTYCLWGTLFLIWTLLALWAFPLGLTAIFLTYRWIISAAEVYSDLLEATFDLHRVTLYQALHWPLPTQTDKEPEYGEKLSTYLLRGGSSLSKPVVFMYTDSPSSSAP